VPETGYRITFDKAVCHSFYLAHEASDFIQ